MRIIFDGDSGGDMGRVVCGVAGTEDSGEISFRLPYIGEGVLGEGAGLNWMRGKDPKTGFAGRAGLRSKMGYLGRRVGSERYGRSCGGTDGKVW